MAKLVCLGCNGAFQSEESHTACFMVPDYGIVMDAGSGLFRVKGLVRTPEINIFVSHPHLDHIGGVFALEELASVVPVRVWGVPDTLAAVRGLLSPPYCAGTPDVKFSELPYGGPFKVGDVKVVWWRVTHTCETVAYRFTFGDGRSLAYVTDTVSTGSSDVTEVRGVDLLLHDLWLGKGGQVNPRGHSSADGLAAFIVKAEVKAVATCHHPPSGDRRTLLRELLEELETAKWPIPAIATEDLLELALDVGHRRHPSSG